MKRLFLLLTLLSMLLISCSTSSSDTRIVYGLTLAPTGIDPHINVSSELGIPLISVYDTLIYQEPESGKFVPGLAQRWEVSEDGLVYTFYLRQDVIFHDGTSFDAEAVQFNLERITSPDLSSQKARFMLGPYERTVVVDEYTVQIHLSEPFSPLLDALSQVYLGMASPTAVKKWGDEYQLHQIGTGPYIFAKYAPKDHLLLQRNPDYAWGPSLYQHETAQVEEIEFRFFTSPSTRSPALETKEAQVMGEIPPNDVARLKNNDEFRIEPVPIPGISLMFFMNSSRPPLDDVRVRQALIHGANRQEIISTVFEDTSPVAYGPLTAVTFGYESKVQEYYPHNPDQAATLLDEAGWSDSDGDGIRDHDGEPLTVDLYVMSWGYLSQVSQLLETQWENLGIKVESQKVSYPEALKIAGEGQHHLMPFSISGTDPDVLRDFFHSEAGFNWSKVKDDKLDTWLDEATHTSNRDERAAIYSKIQLRVMDQALAVPVRDYVNLNGVSNQVQGLRYDAQGWFPWLIDVTLEQ